MHNRCFLLIKQLSKTLIGIHATPFIYYSYKQIDHKPSHEHINIYIFFNSFKIPYFLLLPNIKLFGLPIFWFWVYLMKVILSVPDEGYFECTWWRLFWVYLMKVILSVPDEDYSRNSSCEQNEISTFLLTLGKFPKLLIPPYYLIQTTNYHIIDWTILSCYTPLKFISKIFYVLKSQQEIFT